MINKLISSKTIVAKVIADLDLSDDNLKISDIQEWIGEAVHKIGGLGDSIYNITGIDKDPDLKLCDYQAKLPCNLKSVIQVAYSDSPNGPWRPMRYNTSTMMNGNKRKDHCHNFKHRLVQDDILVQVYLNMNRKSGMTYDEAAAIINEDYDLKTVLTRMVENKDSGFSRRYKDGLDYTFDLTYTIKPGFIVTNKRYGYIKMAYSYIPTDDFGYVMIPDNESVIEAIYWYVVWKLKFPEYLRGDLQQYIYYDIQRNWNFYRKQAYGNLKMPNLDQMESVKNAWLQIYPIVDSHEEFFSTLGQKQIIYNRS